MARPKPPDGYRNWLHYAVATMDTRQPSIDEVADNCGDGDRYAMACAAVAELEAHREAVAVLRLVDVYFDRNMQLETSEEFQRLRHKVTKGISDVEKNSTQETV